MLRVPTAYTWALTTLKMLATLADMLRCEYLTYYLLRVLVLACIAFSSKPDAGTKRACPSSSHRTLIMLLYLLWV